MINEVVTLSSSDSEDEVLVQKCSSKKKIGEYQDSDDELMNLNLDSSEEENYDQKEDDEICEIAAESEQAKKGPSRFSPVPETYRYHHHNQNLGSSVTPSLSPEPLSVENAVLSKKAAPTAKKGRTKKTDSSKAFEKAVKAAETANKKLNKKADCLKFITIVIDSQLLNVIPGSGSILVQLQEAEMIHSIAPTLIPKSIHWKREKREYYVSEDGQVASRSEIFEEEDGVIVLTAEEFIAEALSTSAVHYLKNLLRKWKKSHINLVIFGLAAYHKEQSLKEKKRFREQAASQRSNMQTQGGTESGLSFNEIEQLKVEIVIQTNCSIWPVETSDELGKVLARLTKAVAERPFKEDRLDQQFDFYADDYNGGVKVNKEGHGLERLWQQQLMQFPLVALETSQAIASRYPSPFSLYKAYSACNDENEAALLLQDIPIRRHAGPLSTARRVGPELSRRIHKFMTSKDGSTML